MARHKKPLRSLRTAKDFHDRARKNERAGECEIYEGDNHTIVSVPGKGKMPIKRSDRNKQIGGYLLSAMFKQWRALGLSMFVFLVCLNLIIGA